MIDEAQIVVATLEPLPERLGVTHWFSRLLAAELGLSNVTIAKVWRKWKLQPRRSETFTFSTDPELDGLHLEHAHALHAKHQGRVGSPHYVQLVEVL